MNRRQFLAISARSTTIGLALSSPLLNTAWATTAQSDIKAIAFDGFPIFDPRPIIGRVKTLYPEQGQAFSRAWFKKIFAYTWLRTNGGRYKNFYAIIEDALTYTATQFKVKLSPDNRDQLMGIWLQLKPWPDVVNALKIFKEQGIRIAFLSNLTEEMLRTNTKNAGIEDAFEFYLTTDNVKAFKPDPRAYQMGVDAFKLPKQNIAFAAFGAWDAVGASWFGYPTVWVNRLGAPAENLNAGPITSGRNITTLIDFVNP
ncbi:MAG: haloacid dehalogenase type II [Ectothiorhodospiraceae bacterium]|nr:haloacid dehalogenase type II [Ectothiorhodospiraceae bacterium]